MPSVFLCHSHRDRRFVERLASDLCQHGVAVWYDEWEIKVGDSIPDKVRVGIESHDYLVVVLSQSSVRSKWVQVELDAAWIREIELRSVVILPVLAEDCEVPQLLRSKRYANFTKDYYAGLVDLLVALTPHPGDISPNADIDIVDANAHLWSSSFDEDIDSVISSSKVAGIRRIIASGCSGPVSWAKSLDLSRRYDGLYTSLALHPYFGSDDLDLLGRFLDDPKVVALGDAHLNYFMRSSDWEPDHQLKILTHHFDLAEHHRLPLIVEIRNSGNDCKDAEADFLRLVDSRGARCPKIIVQSTITESLGAECLRRGFYLMIVGVVTFQRAHSYRAMVQRFPSGRLVLASDSPGLAPAPMRGRRNEPSYLRYTLQALADTLQADAAAISRATTQNANSCFNFDEADRRAKQRRPKPMWG